MELDANSVRVLGALMEKEMTVPDQYPLTVNSLLSACNQRSSRDPVMDLGEDEVRNALDTLRQFELAVPARDGGRATRYEHRVRTVLNLRRDETAVICLLLLRGAQTPGELRSRSDRMFQFDDLGGVQACLDRLAGREMPLVRVLAKAPGSREARWMHLLGDAAAVVEGSTFQNRDMGNPVSAGLAERVRVLEEKVAELEARLLESR
jgi:uncharacterized protein YceH (UPF0502 family)